MQPDYGNRNDGFWGGLFSFAAPSGWATQWYWPPGVRGKVRNFTRGRGWRIA